jgi:hypothetical protein
MSKIDSDPGNDDDDGGDLTVLKSIVHPDLIKFLARDKKLADLEEASKRKGADNTFKIVSKSVNEVRKLTTINAGNIELSPSCTKVYLQDGKDFSRIALVKGLLSHKMIADDEKNTGHQIIAFIAIDGVSGIAYIYQQRVKKVAGQNKEPGAL